MANFNPVTQTGTSAGTRRNWTTTFANATGTDRIATPSNLQSHLNACGPGDVIRLTNGTYTGTYTAGVNGTAAQPIIIMAQNPGTYGARNVTLSGGRLILNGAYYIVGGFKYTYGTAPSNLIQISDNNIEFTDVDVQGITTTSGSARVLVISDAATTAWIHHCYFADNAGPNVVTQDINYPAFATGVIIEYNYFFNNTGSQPGGLWVQIGTLPWVYADNHDLANTGTIIRYNEVRACNNCELKSSGNLMYRNYIHDGVGQYMAIANRAGDNNVYNNNYIVNYSRGFRMFSKNNSIINNVMINITGTGAIILAEGSMYSQIGTITNAIHERCENILIANNVISGVTSRGIFIGDAQNGRSANPQPYSPKNVWCYNNIVTSNVGVLIYVADPNAADVASDGYSHAIDSWHRVVNLEVRNNCAYRTGTAVIGDTPADGGSPSGYISWNNGTLTTGSVISGNIETNPLLTATYRVQASSPCINTGITYNKNSNNTATMLDWDGDARLIGGAPDMGVDEFGVGVHIPAQGILYLFGGQVVSLANPFSNFEIVPGQSALLFNGGAALKGKDKAVTGPGILYFNGGNTGKSSEPVAGVLYFNGSALRGDFTWRPLDAAPPTTWRVCN